MASFFEPSASRARSLSRAMELALAASVNTLLFDDPAHAEYPEHRRFGPIDFGTYFDFVLAKLELSAAGEPARLADTRAALARMQARWATGAADAAAATPRITTLSDAFYAPRELSLLREWWDNDPDISLDLTPVSPDELGAARRDIARALDVLARCAPELHEETRAIVREIVVAKPGGAQNMAFDGASSFALWGGFLVNSQKAGWTHYYQTLVHEAAHNLLFAMAREAPLVLNDVEERAYSPLRDTARPLDGVYHAAFVSAREAIALDRALTWQQQGGDLTPQEEAAITALLEQSVIAFWDCAKIVREDAALSELGEAILAECESAMSDAFTVGLAEA